MQLKERFLALKPKVSKLWYNKYALAFVVFAVWVLFFDKFSFQTHRSLSHSISKLEQEKIQVDDQISKTKKQLFDLENNKEKYARERYYMHKPNEEIIVINLEEK